ncbi:hypothetical protein BLS_010052 [Venturia inaequalis]|uniref:U6 snRNA-associated Sm-like protein LSm1 n=1 Tax=Venturia inaequalis TaxID=5025 RepID=A0A8H3U7P2_VENIN|nr:hypothetical protein BLS_010052 [Venturia inaequalis]KAE9964575.1 hypothetical protein EG328_010349 [Venturia inaequalis]KAE9993626.1 hypothetical protein EG327_004147 [Venturia inaequalis]RDI82180.1 hypothetical protein Vi05172_g7762 [Venturia inaequalis]
MQNYALNDMPAGQQAGMQQPLMMGPPPVAQLPPQMFTTAAQLLDLTDKKLMVALRDGKTLFGVLRSWDQFGNLMLQDTIERIYIKNVYADILRGVFIIRGENVEMIGEIDLDREDDIPAGYTEENAEVVHAMYMEEEQKKKKREKAKKKALAKLGFEGELDLSAQ